MLNWVNNNTTGNNEPFLPHPYNWRNYGEVNIEFWKNHQNTTLKNSEELFLKSHDEVIKLANTFTSDDLFSKDSFPWGGGSTLGSYFVSATVSHYEWALKNLEHM